MRKFEIGDTTLPGIGLGTWQAEPGVLEEALKEAVRLGYRHIDCAHLYGNEKAIGKALQKIFSETDTKREDIWITSKLWNDSHGEHVIGALEKTLKDLGLEYLDLYLIHWPIAFRHGTIFPTSADSMVSLEECPLSKTWAEMEKAVDMGLVKFIGVSNFSVKKVKEILEKARIKPVINQVERHPYLQQKELIEFCQSNGIHVTNYSPLGSGGRAWKKDNEPVLLDDPKIAEIAKNYNCTSAQVILAWALQTGTSVAVKSVSPKRLAENLAAEEINLREEDMKSIENLDRHYRFIHGRFFAVKGSSYTVENIWDEKIA